ncbi:hypothetical protein C7T35_37890 [Variovorax sp. WS11]|uniref:pentapeptide repeat-containing protein n=1 Tax=Variovorax sp. WS11 TaxID=1105204 RepID=UPI000D0CC110|nr:pentapeptide repeat-containing protein [Variovorax sp. WS11]NDZ17801.1 pentapeptide repeat-containing protein [Variovorax sp. WS11]PSL79381.1 hypothetical protein C7T35_37890 [Variovorax sp. WS11]
MNGKTALQIFALTLVGASLLYAGFNALSKKCDPLRYAGPFLSPTLPECTGKYREGGRPTSEELSVIQRDLEPKNVESMFFNSGSGYRSAPAAILCDANLNDLNLKGLRFARGSSFRKARLERANLKGTALEQADLRSAGFAGADMTETILYGADLTGANLTGANLKGAQFSDAFLHGARFLIEKEFGAPDAEGIAFAKGLPDIIISRRDSPSTFAAFVRIRKTLKESGLSDGERGITAALKRAEDREMSGFECRWHYVLFDLTTEYGNSPSHALWGIVLIWFGASFAYLFAIARTPLTTGGVGSPCSAIWAVWATDRVKREEGTDKPTPIALRAPFPGTDANAEHRNPALSWLWSWVMALYFSLQSAFHFGWKDLNVGTWISRVQPREYTLRATGWVRTTAGVQSLLSVYLLAIWALTYFGRPFE